MVLCLEVCEIEGSEEKKEHCRKKGFETSRASATRALCSMALYIMLLVNKVTFKHDPTVYGLDDSTVNCRMALLSRKLDKGVAGGSPAGFRQHIT